MTPPCRSILCLSGLDPTGGAGIQADIEAIAAAGGHALPVITTLTVQDSRNVTMSVAVDAEVLARQLDVLLADCPVAAVKIGLLGNAAQIRIIAARLETLRVPVVCDPVLRAGGGRDLANSETIDALRSLLLPQVTLLTPNAGEARRLAGGIADAAQAAHELLALGCRQVLVTGGDEPGDSVVNLLYSPNAVAVRYEWPRLAETFHGAGCTLAASIAARFAQGQPMQHAVADAQRWTHRALERAFAVGRGRRIPGRWQPAGD